MMRYGNCRRSAQVRKFEMKFEVYEVQRTYNGPCGTTPRTVVNGLAFRTVCDGGSLMLVAARVVLVCCVLPWSFPARVSCPRLRFGSMLCRGRSVHQSHARTRWRFSWHTHRHAAGLGLEGMGLSACNGLPPPPCREGPSAQAHVRVARVGGGVRRCHQT
jgi:hypothetical protein